jgi:hypothetical protein
MQLADQPRVRFPDLHRIQAQPASEALAQSFKNPCDPITFELVRAEPSQQIGLPGDVAEHTKNVATEIFLPPGSADSSLNCPKAARPTFENIIGDLVVRVLDL